MAGRAGRSKWKSSLMKDSGQAAMLAGWKRLPVEVVAIRGRPDDLVKNTAPDPVKYDSNTQKLATEVYRRARRQEMTWPTSRARCSMPSSVRMPILNGARSLQLRPKPQNSLAGIGRPSFRPNRPDRPAGPGWCPLVETQGAF